MPDLPTPLATARAATPSDYALFLSFFAQLGLPEDYPIPTHEQWLSYCPNAFFLESATQATATTAAVAYGFAQPRGRNAYVVHVVVDQPFRGGRLGYVLMEKLARHLRGAGCETWALHAAPDNRAALRLYQNVGMRIEHETVTMELPWSALDGLDSEDSEGIAELSTHPIDASGERDSALEDAFHLERGHLASLRQSRIDRASLCLMERDRYVGLGVFDPASRGVYPFEVLRASLIRPLLDVLQPFAKSGHTHVRLILEARPDLVAILSTAGARKVQELLYLRGTIPP